jgi:lysophospholipase L1-like esterase
MSLITAGARVLFQGDSITDFGRDRDQPWGLGSGYVNLIAAWFTARYPQLKVQFLNRGISGNRVADLRGRWDEDALALKPDWVSILIGINDTWRRYDSNDPTSTEAYAADYRDVLARSQVAGARLIVLEPFLLPHPADREQWRVDLDPKIHVARQLAREFGAIFVPLDGVFSAAAAASGSMTDWTPDGVHPTPAGHALIAQAWLSAVGA